MSVRVPTAEEFDAVVQRVAALEAAVFPPDPAPEPEPTPEPEPEPTPEPEPSLQDLHLFVKDASGRGISGAVVTSDGQDPHTTSGEGHTHFAVTGPAIYHVEAAGFVPTDRDLPPGTHNVHLETIPPEPGDLLRGPLRIADGFFVDDRGPVLPTFCHFGEAFSAFVRRPADVRRQLDAIAAAGYHGIRFWDVLGYYDGAWAGKEVTPIAFTNRSGHRVEATPDYYGQLETFLRTVQARGLTVHHSRGDLNAWSSAAILEHCRRVGEVQRAVGASIVALNEACNEAWQNGVTDAGRLASMADALGGHALRALSCPPNATEERADLEDYSRTPADVFYVHGFRQNRSLDRIRHIFTLAYETKPSRRLGWQGEPAGPGDGVTVGQESHPEALALMCAMSLMCRQAWVYMSSPGVFWDGPIEAMPGFAAVAQVRTWLSSTVMQPGTVLCHGGTTWRGVRVLAANQEGTLRCDHALAPDGSVTILVYGEPGTWAIRVDRSFEGRVIHPVTGEAQPITLRSGETWTVNFERGRVLQGRLV